MQSCLRASLTTERKAAVCNCTLTMAKKVAMALFVVATLSAFTASADTSLLADVTIINMLPDMINVHCQSQDRDLHAVLLVGDSGRYYWNFYPRVWFGRTEWYCNFKWPAGGKWHYFVVWTERNQPCKHCLWRVKADGFWRNTEGKYGMTLVHSWLHVFPPQTP